MFDTFFWTMIAILISIVVPTVIFFYFLSLKPRISKPLPNEKYWGRWKVPLPQLGLLNDGDVTEATHFFMSNWSKAANSSLDSSEKDAYIALRALGTSKCHIFAQKVGSHKSMYFFIGNPLDPKNHLREDVSSRFGTDTQILYISNVKDCKSLGKGPENFEMIAVKLGESDIHFTDEENLLVDSLLEATKYAKIAAVSKEKMKYLEERADISDTLANKALELANRKTSEEGESRLIAGTPPLVAVTTPESKGFHFPQTKWFGGWQMAIALLAFIITPLTMTYLHVEYQDQTTIAVAVALVTFFLYPFIRKIVK